MVFHVLYPLWGFYNERPHCFEPQVSLAFYSIQVYRYIFVLPHFYGIFWSEFSDFKIFEFSFSCLILCLAFLQWDPSLFPASSQSVIQFKSICIIFVFPYFCGIFKVNLVISKHLKFSFSCLILCLRVSTMRSLTVSSVKSVCCSIQTKVFLYYFCFCIFFRNFNVKNCDF